MEGTTNVADISLTSLTRRLRRARRRATEVKVRAAPPGASVSTPLAIWGSCRCIMLAYHISEETL